jgi:molybdopterin/thiamine biosynthesis adenylyltransferase
MKNKYKTIFSRNIGVFTNSEQEKLRKSTVAIAGMGGVGGLLAERLIRLGIGNLKITDPGTFEESNLNRQFGSSVQSLGSNKAEVVYHEISNINTQAKIYCSNTGIKTGKDARDLVNGSDVVIDEMDYGAWKESIFLQRAARHKGIYYLFAGAIGFGALVTVFDPAGITLEEYNKLPANVDLNNVKELAVPAERILPVVPSYAMAALSMDMIQDIIAGQRPVPTCSIGVGLTSILAAGEAVNILLKRREIIKAPRYIYFDLLDQKFIIGSVS